MMYYTRTSTNPFSGSSRTLEGGRRSISSASWLDNLRNNFTPNQKLEEIIDINKNLKLFSNEQLNILNPRRFYG